MSRIHKDWLKAYVELRTESTEAPSHVHFWCGVSAIAGALKRKVWVDERNFRWYPNFYIVIVAPPGIISKSTSADLAINLLEEVPGISIGPSIITWQALVQHLSEATEGIMWEDGSISTMSALTCCSSELGNLLDPEDRQLVDTLITLYDGRRELKKVTKTAGSETIENCWVNIIGCTTPNWIQHYVPRPLVGGGFTSRCIWVVAEEKARVIAYPSMFVSKDHDIRVERLVADLREIAEIKGEYVLTPEARAYGVKWYEALYENRFTNPLFAADFAGGFARIQTQAHKLAMVLAASRRDELVITEADLAEAIDIVEETSLKAKTVFDKIGLTDVSRYRDILLTHIQRSGPQGIDYIDLYQRVSNYLPKVNDYQDLVHSLIAEEKILRRATPDGRSLLVPVQAVQAPSTQP